METVDLVIPNFQGEQLLAPCLDAVFAQTLRPARILVIDDGSTDASAALVARYPGSSGSRSARTAASPRR